MSYFKTRQKTVFYNLINFENLKKMSIYDYQSIGKFFFQRVEKFLNEDNKI